MVIAAMALKAMAANKFALLAAAIAACAALVAAIAMAPVDSAPDVVPDRPGIREIYLTAAGGREWRLNDTSPRDGLTISPAAAPIYPMSDGTWQLSRETDSPNTGFRMYVISPDVWHNVEMTGYFRLKSFSFEEEFAFAVRTGQHTVQDPCDGTAYYGALSFGGKTWFQKEVVHAEGGYTGKRHSSLSVEPLTDNRLVGIKMIAYNVDAGVKLELWVDDRADDNWKKMAETIDSGGWSSDIGACGRAPDHVISEPRPRVTFRVDNATFDFKDLSVREIQPPSV